MSVNIAPGNDQVAEQDSPTGFSRRNFLQLAGGIAGAGLFMASCKRSGTGTVFIGSGDNALLNYLYILEQLQAAFYSQAAATPYYGITASELELLQDTRDHEIAHSEYLHALLGSNAITAIAPDFSAVNFSDRNSVLSHAYLLEDLTIAGYIGAAELFTNTSYPIAFAKIVAVEARHSAYYRDIYNYNSFADSTVINTSGTNAGLNQDNTPQAVLAIAETYCQTIFDSRELPN